VLEILAAGTAALNTLEFKEEVNFLEIVDKIFLFKFLFCLFVRIWKIYKKKKKKN